MTENFRPLYDHVTLRLEKPDEMSPSGLLFIPDTAKEERGIEGVITHVGRGICNYKNGSWKDLDVKVGDRVIVQSKYTGHEVFLNGAKHLVVRQADICAVLE
jgi:co-chaperonin GroES (HSP10)